MHIIAQDAARAKEIHDEKRAMSDRRNRSRRAAVCAADAFGAGKFTACDKFGYGAGRVDLNTAVVEPLQCPSVRDAHDRAARRGNAAA